MEFYKFTPLGFNCELAFLLQKRGYSQSKEFFAWTFARANGVRRSIEADFLDVGIRENIRPHPGGELVWDIFYDLSFHSPLVSNGQNTFDRPDHERLHAFFLSGIRRKAKGFIAELKSDLPIAYLAKYDGDNPRDDAIAFRDLFENKRNGAPFHIYFVQEANRYEENWSEPGISNRYVSRFAPILDAHDIDYQSWAGVLADITITLPLG